MSASSAPILLACVSQDNPSTVDSAAPVILLARGHVTAAKARGRAPARASRGCSTAGVVGADPPPPPPLVLIGHAASLTPY